MDRKEGLDIRIRNVRKELNMSKKEFAERMGVSQGTVSWSEQPDKNVPDSTIKSICTIFNVNEDYLLYDQLPKFIQPDTFSLDSFIEERGGSDLEKEIIKTYFELDPEVRKAVFDHFKNKFFPQPKRNPLFDGIPDTPEELERMYPVIDMKKNKDIG
jgi:transcriptional regulator with XRE-family HTH domain